MIETVAVLMVLPLGFVGVDWQQWHALSKIICFTILQFIVPLACKGQTVFGSLTGISLDNKKRTPLWRLLYYLLRAALLAAIILPLNVWSLLLVILFWASWLAFHKLPYELIDRLFKK
jgi:hypothetical protein